ncbi:MAG TPA: FAD-dependent oxidoreductase [Dokdonella sp.]|uniref:ferredoxin--NADP reductase n=1 Tax=Dokdonella sp. TaxID=2291710 RepID=UPI002D7E75B0|nr:FAD-dependent oxidoreductase [Dokdonella sp.]HET9031474.1 FAD-dependent oxidoreductase [Dokdonella sp.]
MSAQPSVLLQRETVAEGTVAFQLQKPEGFIFKPGQAIDLILDDPQLGEDSRTHAFSITSTPDESSLAIATRMRDSAYKRALGRLETGAKVSIDGPFGSMTLHNKASRAACFIAGGIGITPFMSMLRHSLASKSAHRLMLIYSNRRPEDSAFLAELQDYAKQSERFQLVATMTDMDKSTHTWSGERARIDAAFLTRVSAGLESPIFYVAGPPALVAGVRAALTAAGIDDDDIRSEDFFGY